MRGHPEYNVAKAIAEYMRFQYPKVLFRTDMAGLNLSKAQAGMNKMVQSGKGWPDFFIAEPKPSALLVDTAMFGEGDTIADIKELLRQACPIMYQPRNGGVSTPVELTGYHGMFLELKSPGEKIRRTENARKILKGESKLRMAGDWWDDHVEEQAACLELLRCKGYYADFAVGFDSAREQIDNYLKSNHYYDKSIQTHKSAR